MNKIIITGNATRAPEEGRTQGGTPWVRFGVAVNGYPNKETGETHVDFFDVLAFDRLTAVAVSKCVKKGDKIGVIGRMNQKTYTDKDGARRVSWSLIAEQIEFLTPKQKEKIDNEAPANAKKMEEYGEIPF